MLYGRLESTGQLFKFNEEYLPDFIVTKGLESDLYIEDEDGNMVATTFGTFLDKVQSIEHRATYIERLISLQMGEEEPKEIVFEC